MAVIIESTENWKEDKVNLKEAISSLKTSMSDYKAERKSGWKSFKKQYHTEMDTIQLSLKKMLHDHKK